MKKSFIVFIVFFSSFHTLCLAAENHTNARLVNYAVGRHDHNYFLLLPINISDFECLGHYPFTAFMFLKNYDAEKISKLTVKELNSGSLAGNDSCCASAEYFDVLKFDKIRGFENMARDLERFDEFSITEKKQEIISRLLDCHAAYKKEYQTHLRGMNGSYLFRKSKFGFLIGRPLEAYNENVEINEGESPSAFYDQIDKGHYDFDRRFIKIEPLSPYSKIGSSGWEYHYIQKYKAKYRDKKYKENAKLYHRDFPEEIDVPLTIEDAKKLFADSERVFSETILKVTPKEGYFGYPGIHFFVMTSSFEIKKVIKRFYKKQSWSHKEKRFISDPVLTIELESNEDHPFH
jgi:hypothetical protein